MGMYEVRNGRVIETRVYQEEIEPTIRTVWEKGNKYHDYYLDSARVKRVLVKARDRHLDDVEGMEKLIQQLKAKKY